MTPGGAVLLVCAGFAAGAVNAVAGGGSLISFPALLGAGLASVPANVTNTIALWPGYLGGALGYRRELIAMRKQLYVLIGISIVGAVAGAVLLLSTPGSLFSVLVPWLVLLGTVLFAIQPVVSRRIKSVQPSEPDVNEGHPLPAQVGVFLASVYGAYFGAGLGVMLLAVLGIFAPADLQHLNATKNSLSLSINTVALIAFALFGPVDWIAVLVMAIASLGGGYLGALGAKRLSPLLLRSFVILLGVAVTVKLFIGR